MLIATWQLACPRDLLSPPLTCWDFRRPLHLPAVYMVGSRDPNSSPPTSAANAFPLSCHPNPTACSFVGCRHPLTPPTGLGPVSVWLVCLCLRLVLRYTHLLSVVSSWVQNVLHVLFCKIVVALLRMFSLFFSERPNICLAENEGLSLSQLP